MVIVAKPSSRNYDGRVVCGYEATDGTITVFIRKGSPAEALRILRRKRWEAKEYAANRYIVDWRTGEVIYTGRRNIGATAREE